MCRHCGLEEETEWNLLLDCPAWQMQLDKLGTVTASEPGAFDHCEVCAGDGEGYRSDVVAALFPEGPPRGLFSRIRQQQQHHQQKRSGQEGFFF